MVKKSAIVIGAGIVGLATARALAVRGYTVTVIERDHRAVGASIRNFGMIWPIGQPDGELYAQASLSRKIWKETCDSARLWYNESGSLHLAYSRDELAVLEELSLAYAGRGYRMIGASETNSLSESVVSEGLLGALYSKEEIIVDPRKAIAGLPGWLSEKYGVEFIWGKAVTSVKYPYAFAGLESFGADEIFICSGADFETLYPETFALQPLTRCKLQMLKMSMPDPEWQLGPALCGGLSLLHYTSFKTAPSLDILRARIEKEFPEYLSLGIHVMMCQNSDGDLIIGDSHEYGPTHDPFIRGEINVLILDYLRKFAAFKGGQIIENWHGVYPKLTNGQTNIILEPAQGVTIINGLGGAGMTLSFGLTETLIASRH